MGGKHLKTIDMETLNKKQSMYNEIEKHGNNLLVIFPNARLKDPVKLSKRLFSLENKAHALTTYECNTGEDKDPELCNILNKVKVELFGKNPEDLELYKSVFINGDPRGYALKIKSEIVRERNLRISQDMGGYGILAPDFN